MPNTIETNDHRNIRFIQAKIAGFPTHIKQKICNQYDKLHTQNGIKTANLSILHLPKPAPDYSDEKMDDIAKLIMQNALNELQNDATESEYLRATDINLHRRRLRKSHRTQREREEITFQTLGENNPYSSKRAQQDMKKAAKNAEDFLKTKAIPTENNFIQLDEIAKIAAENQTYEKRGQIMAMSEIMKRNKWKAAFSVITLPPIKHPKSKKWDGTTPDKSHQWANKKWQQIRAIMSKNHEEGEDWMCLRTVEPHKDACPHYNLVAVGSDEILEELKTLLKQKYLLDDDCYNDKKSEKIRIKFNKETDQKACRKIASYASKYAIKTYMPSHRHKTDEQANTYEACKAWRQSWNIRAFSFLGFAPSGLWKECRSCRYNKAAELPLVEHAITTNFTEFHFEYFNMKKQNKIRPIKIMVQNKYKETISKIIGHSFNEIIITEQDPKKKAQIITLEVTLNLIKPRERIGCADPSECHYSTQYKMPDH